MSASNWRACPQCLARMEARAREKRVWLNDQYGKVDRETWEKKKAELEELRELLIQNRMEQTLREDYGFGFDVDGEFYVVYSASCQAPGCDFHYQYKHHEPVSMDETIDDCDEE